MIYPLTNELIESLCPLNNRELLRNMLTNSFQFSATDRIQLATIKNTSWDIEKIEDNIQFANEDWRDLLVRAGFAESLDEHESWQKNAIKLASIDF